MSARHSTKTAISAQIGWTELAMREGDGLEVHLLWSKSAGRVKVAVADSRNDTGFEFDVPGADALAAFHHPLAYAPSWSFPSTQADREPLDLRTQA